MQGNLYRDRMKRVFDFLASLAGLILLSPLFLLIGMIIMLSSPGGVIFTQERIGKGFEKFKLYKFRSMFPNAPSKGLAITSTDDPRITPIGHFLRKYKLDELPQLINVLRGDMSLVGPRPEVEKYVLIFKEEYTQVLGIRPGITDFASLKFRNENELLYDYPDKELKYINEILPQKLYLNKMYLNNHSFQIDLKIIFCTVLGKDF